MAINPLMVLWLEHLSRRDVLAGADAIIELGPQDLLASCRGALNAVARRIGGADLAASFDTLFPDSSEPPPPGAQKPFYALFGLKHYHAIDRYNPNADYDFDLNLPLDLDLGRTWPVVSNFGTAEHCFNIGACFETMHNLTAPGGLMLHVLPAMGDLDHGFFNINPMLYGRLANANGYRIEDIRYVDNLLMRCLRCADAPEPAFDFDALPIGIDILRDRPAFARAAAELFLQNMADEETRSRIMPLGPGAASMVFDYCFVALRKRHDAPFIMPHQPYPEGPHWADEDFV